MSTGLGPHLRLQAIGVLLHWCPACNRPHEIHLQASSHAQRKRWEWNDNMARPTFSPDLLVEGMAGGVCHYYITDQRIHFLSDSTHALAGLTVPLPIYPSHNLA
ncbi:MAG: ammonia monooxygenase [Ramlibacter sp.]|jgi:hypothetical protein|nr:ammonia monooxygenase [Ramlibacter sp.]